MLRPIFLIVAITTLAGCASMSKENSAQGPMPTAHVADESSDSSFSNGGREVASAQCLFDLEEREARRIKLYYRKARSFSYDDVAEVRKMPAFYKRMIEHYMRAARGWKGGSEDSMFEDYLSGDGGYIQRIVWGKGQNRRVFVDVSHYPGDNHYGIIYETTNNKPVPVLAINDGDFENCRVSVPEAARLRK